MKPPAVLFDRDGTLFSVAHHMVPTTDVHGFDTGNTGPASWYDYNASPRFDSPVPVVAALFHAIRPGVTKIITSGRMEHTRRSMLDGMMKHDLVPDYLLMRKDKDQRRDSIVKREIYLGQIEPHFDVRYVIDDRPTVVEMWRELGLSVLAVIDPGIPPTIGGYRR